MKKELGIFILLVVLCAVTTLENARFLSPENLINMANIIGMFGIFGIGAGLVIVTSGIDLSVGSLIALIGILLIMALTEWHWPWPLAALFVLGVAMVLGWVHGFLITRFHMQPFIVTLCGLLLYRGLARFIAQDTTIGFGDLPGFGTLRSLASGRWLGVPMPFVLLIIVSIIMWFVLHRSVYGRYLLAVGRNEEAARFSGINTRRVIASSYVLAGLLTGISGILLAFYTNSVTPSTHGTFYELYGIAAAVLGGCSLRGGEGSILGILIGTALLQVLQNLVNLLGIPSSLNFAVMGAVVLVGVLADQIFKQRAASRTKSR
ncbi:MAG: ABC transporter permease [Verrucomicrobiota bacterium]|nr:ABC transporter permease [Verrucomicrobiota bacterium]MDE3068838.1 ABC transporter permease [Verrucomicrobiota bacterium]